MSGSDELMCALCNVIEQAPEGAVRELQNAMNAYREKYGRTWTHVRKQPFARKLLDAMEEGCECSLIMYGEDNDSIEADGGVSTP